MSQQIRTFLASVFAYIKANWHLWFDDFRWPLFFKIMGGVYASAFGAAVKFQMPERYHAWFAGVFTVIAAVVFILNPKKRKWVEADSSTAPETKASN